MARSSSGHVLRDGSAGGTVTRSVVGCLVAALRPAEWTKNLLVFAALVFAVRLFDPRSVALAFGTFAVFCALSSAAYLGNDIADRDYDRQHPLKRNRPVASGSLPVSVAQGAAFLLAGVGLAGAYMISPGVGAAALGYLALQVLYSRSLKRKVILDVMAVATGFVLRAHAGASAIDVSISHWLLICTILLALFIVLAKRRHELVLLADDAPMHRPILGEYSPLLLDQMIAVVAAAALIAYILYATSPETAARFGTPYMGLTIPFPIYGIFRYLYLVHQRAGGGNPADLLLADKPLFACVVLWTALVVLIVYWGIPGL